MNAAPITQPSRIESLDVMRGFAVLGILAVNAALFAAPWQASANPNLAPLAVTDATLWSWLAMHVLFEFKCITLFSLLFGASLYMVGGDGADAEANALLRRRLAWLMMFGLIHAILIWYGDILVTYALTGLLVSPARGWPARVLLTFGVSLYLAALALNGLNGLGYAALTAAQAGELEALIWAPPAAELERIARAYQGDLVGALRENFMTWRGYITGGLVLLVMRTAGVMMIGMALYKLGFLSGRAPAWVYGLVAMAGAAALALIAWQAWLNAEADFGFVHMHARGTFANNALSILGSLFYASLAVLAVKASAGLITKPLAAVGRMAFSNYIAQSLIMTTLFWGGRGFGLFGEVDRVTLWGVVIAVWVLQLICSPLWLKHFAMGPLEWVWRRLSYAKPLPLRRAG